MTFILYLQLRQIIIDRLNLRRLGCWRRSSPSPSPSSTAKRLSFHKVVILIHQSGRWQQAGWRAGLKKIRQHQLGGRCLTIWHQKGKSAEVEEVPWRRCFHIKNFFLATLNPLNSGEDEASCSSWQRSHSRTGVDFLQQWECIKTFSLLPMSMPLCWKEQR